MRRKYNLTDKIKNFIVLIKKEIQSNFICKKECNQKQKSKDYKIATTVFNVIELLSFLLIHLYMKKYKKFSYFFVIIKNIFEYTL